MLTLISFDNHNNFQPTDFQSEDTLFVPGHKPLEESKFYVEIDDVSSLYNFFKYYLLSNQRHYGIVEFDLNGLFYSGQNLTQSELYTTFIVTYLQEILRDYNYDNIVIPYIYGEVSHLTTLLEWIDKEFAPTMFDGNITVVTTIDYNPANRPDNFCLEVR